jgi:hypothetical protein
VKEINEKGKLFLFGKNLKILLCIAILFLKNCICVTGIIAINMKYYIYSYNLQANTILEKKKKKIF